MPIVAILAAFLAVWLCLPHRSMAQNPSSPTVVVVLAPYLTWGDIDPSNTPELWSLADRSALGAINAKSRSRIKELTDEAGSPLEGALSISSGSWAAYDPEAAAAYSVGERYEVGTAAEAFRRTTGDQVGTNRIVFLGMPVTQRVNAESSFQAVPGTLGHAVEEAGGITAAVGNSDVGYVTGEQRRVRPAALVAMNRDGLVSLGDVSTGLLREHPYAPFGMETDLKKFAEVLASARRQASKVPGPTLVVLDPGDLYRVAKFRTQVTEEVYAGHRIRALHSLDQVLSIALEQFEGATIMVVGQSSGDPERGELESLAPVILYGPGHGGYLTSDSTQRLGLVTNLDVTASILDTMKAERPVEVLGNRMRSVSTRESTKARVERLALMTDTAVAVDAVKPAVVNTFVAVTVLALLFTAFVLIRAGTWRQESRHRASVAVRAVLLLVACVPVSGWLMFAPLRWPRTSTAAVLTLSATTVVLWLVALMLWRLYRSRTPVVFVCLLTAAVIMADQLFGAPASFTNFFGYSPLLAARFYGMGNEAAAVLFGSSITGLALLFDDSPASGFTKWAKRIGLPLVGLAVLLTAAAPWLGANIGVAIWGVVGFALAWVVMNGHHVSFRSIFWLAAAIVLIIAVFAAIDIFGSESTHLARAIGSAEKGGLQELWTIVVRKAQTNARVLTRTNWAYILIATLAFLGLQRWRPHGDFAATLSENKHFADAITVSLIAGLVAYFTEDSGVVIPALAVFYIGVALSWLMLSRMGSPQPDTRAVSGAAS